MLPRPLTSGLLAAGLALSVVPAVYVVTTPTAAADLDMPYTELPSEPLPEQKVEFGTGWYIRGDIAGTQTYALTAYQVPESTLTEAQLARSNRLGYDLSLGAGYKFTNAFRADVNVDFHQPLKSINTDSYCYNSASLGCSGYGQLYTYDALINGFFDIGTWGPATPYVGAGLGVAFGNYKGRLYDNGLTYGVGTAYQNFAFALMAGVAFDIFDHTKLDIGYRYLNNGQSFAGVPLYYHEVRAGIRYMIDN